MCRMIRRRTLSGRRSRIFAASSTILHDRQGARHRPVDGRLRGAPLRSSLSRTRVCRSWSPGQGRGRRPKSVRPSGAIAQPVAERFEREPMEQVAPMYAMGPARVQFRDKDPQGWAQFCQLLKQQSAKGHASRCVAYRSCGESIYELGDRMARLTVPTLIVAGDEDDACLEPALYMKRMISTAGLLIIPRSGHTINLRSRTCSTVHVLDFVGLVNAGRWMPRNSASVSRSAILPTAMAVSSRIGLIHRACGPYHRVWGPKGTSACRSASLSRAIIVSGDCAGQIECTQPYLRRASSRMSAPATFGMLEVRFPPPSHRSLFFCCPLPRMRRGGRQRGFRERRVGQAARMRAGGDGSPRLSRVHASPSASQQHALQGAQGGADTADAAGPRS
jgi:hypothetical protein